MTAPEPVEEQVARVADKLAGEFSGAVGPGVIRNLVDEVYATYADARISQFVPVLVDRTVRERMRLPAAGHGTRSD